jgi:hypothetical protein
MEETNAPSGSKRVCNRFADLEGRRPPSWCWSGGVDRIAGPRSDPTISAPQEVQGRPARLYEDPRARDSSPSPPARNNSRPAKYFLRRPRTALAAAGPRGTPARGLVKAAHGRFCGSYGVLVSDPEGGEPHARIPVGRVGTPTFQLTQPLLLVRVE